MSVFPSIWRAGLALSVGLGVALSAGCDGYTDLPLPTRSVVEFEVESVALYASGLGTLQLRAQLPAEATGQITVVAAPYIESGAVAIANWAVGPCDTSAPQALDDDLRVCLAIRAAAGPPPSDFSVVMVLEERSASRRFTVGVEVTP